MQITTICTHLLTAVTACLIVQRLSGGACDVGGDNIGRVPVQAAAGPVISHRGPRVRMGGGFLHVAQRNPGIQRGRDECVSQRVRGDWLGDPGPAGDPADDPPGAVPVQPPAVPGQEHGTVGALADGQIDRPDGARCQRDGDDLAALAGDGQRPVAALQAQVLDVRAGRL